MKVLNGSQVNLYKNARKFKGIRVRQQIYINKFYLFTYKYGEPKKQFAL